MKILHFKELHSTNSYLLDLISKQPCEEGLVIQSDIQANGRGQSGNFWESEARKNLTFSLLLCPTFLAINEQFIISQMVAISIKKVLDSFGKGFTVKWPNDIYWHNQKIGGILIENSIMGSRIEHTVIGVGINVNQQKFESDAPNPVSLIQIIEKQTDIIVLMKSIVREILAQYTELVQGGDDLIRERYAQSLYRRQGYYPYKDANGLFNAKAEKVLPDGRLCLITENGDQRQYYFKEVKFIF